MICALCWFRDRASRNLVAGIGALLDVSPTYKAWRGELVRGLGTAERDHRRNGGGPILYSRMWKRDLVPITWMHTLGERRFGLQRPPRGQIALFSDDVITPANLHIDFGGKRGR